MTETIPTDYAYNSFKNDVLTQEELTNFSIVHSEGVDAIDYIENVLDHNPDEIKRRHFFYSLIYYDSISTYWFEYIRYSKEELKKHIQNQIIFSYDHIVNYLQNKTEYTYQKVKEYRSFIRTTYIPEFNSGIIHDDIYNSTPTFCFYNFLGEKDDDLTNYAIKTKNDYIEKKIMNKILFTPESLKRMCFAVIPTKIRHKIKHIIIL